MANKYAIANWKMNLGHKENIKLAKEFKNNFNRFSTKEVVVLPDFASLTEIIKIFKNSKIAVGAQDVYWSGYGAYTGEICAEKLREIGCKYVLMGHSERRVYLNESFEQINSKLKKVLSVGKLVPIACVGENHQERKAGKSKNIIVAQIKKVFKGIKLGVNQKLLIAYEPIWAISTFGPGLAIKPDDAEEAHKIIREAVNKIFGEKVSEKQIRIIYGGSVNSKNANSFANIENVDGALVGGASLKAKEFYKLSKIILDK